MVVGPSYRYHARIVAVHDGDTLTADTFLGLGTTHHDEDLGFDLRIESHQLILRVPFRLAGCNAAELGTPGGDAAAHNLAGLLPPGTSVVVHSHRPLAPIPADKYGTRWDADIALPDGTDLVTKLLSEGWVAAWLGTGPKPVPPWPRPTI